ncbi:VOC family protein [Deminuibacter soli]|uniref:VOC family protein n=1 Tax=Deminuibacter soli TaxID=2291815 RepID=A0A3E1NCV8_9BACT|nr:VOC family protein [Deminuibacter soli]RFM25654.1 VOC family protein [Deminuibacter soli]
MLKNAKAFSSFAVKDIQQAKQFYGDKLGIAVTEDDMGVLSLELNGVDVMIYPKPDYTPATYTVLNFSISDIDKTVDELNKAGITMLQYDDPIKTDAKGICRNSEGPVIAWFTDPSGNILSVVQREA